VLCYYHAQEFLYKDYPSVASATVVLGFVFVLCVSFLCQLLAAGASCVIRAAKLTADLLHFCQYVLIIVVDDDNDLSW